MLKREKISSGSQSTDLLLCRVKTLEEANRVRHKIMKHKLRSTVYVFIRKRHYDIFISNEFGGMPTSEHFETLRTFIYEDEDECLLEEAPADSQN